MNRLLNGLIALMLPAMVGCGTAKVQDVPEEIYACPMPGEPGWEDEPVSQKSDVRSQMSEVKTDTIVMNDTTTNKIN